MMTTAQQLSARAADLVAQRRRFVQATVVRAQCPTSARPGDAAIVQPDGTIEGFVGGQCAEESVRVAALAVLRSGDSTLLRILPDGSEGFPDTPGAITTINPCLSGGAIEVFLEPKFPAARIAVVGNTPIAEALVQFGSPLGFSMDPLTEIESVAGSTALIIASHGRDEAESVRLALDAGVDFIGLVASKTRGTSVVEAMDLNSDELKIVRSPVGLDIGARTAEEIALSILAEIVRAVRVDGLRAPKLGDESLLPETAIDPVCGMTVTIGVDTAHLTYDGIDHWFCNPGCRTRYSEELGVS
jgi:xanthine dehydrogenase accessory factor